MMNFLIWILLLLVFPVNDAIAGSKKFGPYEGRVVEKGTGQPIMGAVVVMVVYAQTPKNRNGYLYYDSSLAGASEVVTDENGKFTVLAHDVQKPTSDSVLCEERFVVFKPGYIYYPDSGTGPIFVPNGTLPESKFVTITLPKRAADNKGQIESPYLSDVEDKLYVLSQLLDSERIDSGYQPYHLDNYWRSKGLIRNDEKTILDCELYRRAYVTILSSTHGIGKSSNNNNNSIAYSEKSPSTDTINVKYYFREEQDELINKITNKHIKHNIDKDGSVSLAREQKTDLDKIVKEIDTKPRIMFINDEYKNLFIELLEDNNIPYILRKLPYATGYDIICGHEYKDRLEKIKILFFNKILKLN